MATRSASPLKPGDWRELQFVFTRGGLSIWSGGATISRSNVRRIAVDFTVWFFFQGTGELVDSKGKTYPLRPGVCLCVSPGMEFEARQTGNDLLGDSYFHFDLRLSGSPLPRAQWPDFPFYSEVSDVTFYDHSTRKILELYNRQFFPGYQPREEDGLEAECLLKTLLLGLIRNRVEEAHGYAAGVDRRHERIVSAALSKLYESPGRFRSVEELARFCGYSPSWFRVLCLKLTGQKPIDILIKARAEHAKNYLANTELTIGEIAEQLGYENIYYFSRQFREAIGLTASDYRRQRMAIAQAGFPAAERRSKLSSRKKPG